MSKGLGDLDATVLARPSVVAQASGGLTPGPRHQVLWERHERERAWECPLREGGTQVAFSELERRFAVLPEHLGKSIAPALESDRGRSVVARANARRYLISPEVLGNLGTFGPRDLVDPYAWSSLAASAAQTLSHLALLREATDGDPSTLMMPSRLGFASIRPSTLSLSS